MSTQTPSLTDKEQVEEFLRSLDIEFRIDPPFIRLGEGMNNVGGYPGHEVIFEFDKKGNFLEIGAYK